MKVGVFGGSFNPPHLGHLNSLQTVLKKTGLKKIHVVPAFLNPLKSPIEGPSAEQRLEMTRLAVESWGDAFVVDDQEVKRGGKSYTIETIKNFRKKVAAEDLFLIIGMDKFEELESWKDIDQILDETNIIVTSRPGCEFPETIEDLPKKIRKITADFDFNFVELKNGRNIQFVNLNDIEISSTELRKWLRSGKKMDRHLPLAVESYIRKNGLYQNKGYKISDYEKFTHFCGKVLFEKKGIQVRGFDLRKMSAPSEFALIASGTSTKHATSLAENLSAAVKEEFNVFPLSVEGAEEGRWVVIDYGTLIIHIFYDFVRQEYSLENLWNAAIDMGLREDTTSKR